MAVCGAPDFATSIASVLVTPDEFDGAKGEMVARFNGEDRSRGNLRDVFHPWDTIAAWAARNTVLRPGDIGRGDRDPPKPHRAAAGIGRELTRAVCAAVTSVQDGPVESELVGRDLELASLEEWLAEPWGRLAVFEGPAGIGKTSVWRYACSRAAGLGYAVAASSPGEGERHLVFAGLTDLLGPLLAGTADAMAPPRRRALEAALLLGEVEAKPLDERAVAFAAFDVLRLAGRERPLVLAIDDAQWLDPSSMAVIAFAFRRLDASDGVAMLVARRSGVEHDSSRLFVDAVEPARRTINAMRPLSVGAVHRLYRQRLGLSLPRPRLLQIHERSGGNPLFALEIGQALASGPVTPRSELPIPQSLTAALRARLSHLSPDARRVALLAAAAAEPTTDLVVAAFDRSDAAGAISEVARAGIFSTDDGRLHFGHPLFASVAYAHGSDAERREAHAALAGLVAAPEERARHLALAKGSPDAGAAAALDEAADMAEARGAQAASAGFREWAAEMTPARDTDARASRLVAAGYASFVSGDAERARALLEPVAAAPGPRQHEAQWRLGTVLDETTGGWEAAREHWLEALETDDLELRVHVERSIATSALYSASVQTALSHSTKAVDAAERLGNPRVLAYALATDGFVRTLGGEPGAPDVLAAALALDPGGDLPDLEWSPHAVAADCARLALDLEAAGAETGRVYELAVARGDFGMELWAAYTKAQVATDAGARELARELHAQVDELVEQSGLMRLPALRLAARLEALWGDADRCRALTARCLAGARSGSERLHELQALAVLGTLELSEGDADAAARTLQSARALASELGIGAPGITRLVVDESEALTGIGRFDEAEAVLATFESRALALGYAWAGPLVERARGLIAAGRGNLESGVRLLRAADAGRDELPIPLERVRIDLCLGRVLRRLKRRAEAREALDRAVAGFESLGNERWAAQARAERARIGGRSQAGGLTATEARVAALAAAGKANKEIAAALFVTASTVEAHLSRVYKKLGVHSRGQLAGALAEQGPGISSLSPAEGST